jgi:exodeoxyribonuclease III
MRIISFNANGIRSANSKGFFEWLAGQKADVVAVQELKAQDKDIADEIRTSSGMQGYFHSAVKPGYSGVALYCRAEPLSVDVGLGIKDIDSEGRYICAHFKKLSVISLYLPSGTSSDERQQVKYSFMKRFFPMLKKLGDEGRDIIVAGDWNIAHQQIDIKNWKSNQTHSGFLPEEREWMTKVLSKTEFVDIFRKLYPDVPGYTWWSNFGQAYAKDVGWRIDYQLATKALAEKALSASVYKEKKFSDHAPLIVDYDYKLP